MNVLSGWNPSCNFVHPSDESSKAFESGLRPRRKNHANRRVAAGVRESVERDIDAVALVTLDFGDRVVNRLPGAPSDENQMRDLQRDARLARDVGHLAHGQDVVRNAAVEEQRALRVRAQMRGQHAAGRRGHARERGQLGRLRDHPGKIAEPARQSDRAVSHRALDHRLHRAQLLRRRLARVGAHHAQPNTAMPRQMRDVERESLPLQIRGEARHVVPFPIELALGAQPARLIEHPLPLAHHRRDREAAIAADEGGHALQQKRLQDLPMIGNRQHPVGMRVQIDKARRNREPGRIDLARRGRGRGVARIDQRGDLAILDCDIGA